MPTTSETLALARRLQREGDSRGAEQQAREVLQQDPANAEALHVLGVALHASGRLAEAVPCYQEALRRKPDWAEAANDLGAALAMQGRLDEAIATFQRVLALRPDFTQAHANLANALRARGRTQEALSHLEQAVLRDPGQIDAHVSLIQAQLQQGQSEHGETSLHRLLGQIASGKAGAAEKVALYERIIKALPHAAAAYNDLGWLLTDQGRPAEGLILFRQAIRLKRDLRQAHSNLAWALQQLGYFEEALASHEVALRLQPTDPALHSNLGIALDYLGRHEEALACYRYALRLDPEHAAGHYLRGLTLLRLGQFAEGWREYEWRWKYKHADLTPRALERPLWDGTPRPGQTLLVYCEQGLGDTFQFARYLPLARERVGRVVLQASRALLPLLATCPGIDVLVAENENLPGHDLGAPLVSLAGLLRPASPLPMEGPYLQADPARILSWRKTLEEYPGRRVGIAWQGNPQHRFDRLRSFPMRHFLELSRLEGVQLFSLQKGAGAEQLQDFAERERVVDLGSRLDSDTGLADVAAVMESLALVITCDSALAHLAGALGRPVWVALGANLDYRWLLHRESSPWYPSMRLFRQRERGNWEELFGRMVQALRSENYMQKQRCDLVNGS